MQRIVPCLWFSDQAEAAVGFYLSIFPRARIVTTTRYLEGSHRATGSVMAITFELDGQEFVALNGGPQYTFSPATSMIAFCDSQEEVDRYWTLLSAGASEGVCGWLTDRFGVTWQVVPREFIEMLTGPNTAGAKRAMDGMLTMKKLDLPTLRRAFESD